MKQLLYKEFRLAMHPTCPLFLALSAMLLIPNYPYLVVFFYTGLAIFFTCLSGRENNDILYTVTLPVRKEDAVKARFAFAVILQLLQLLIAVPFAALRQSFSLPGNQVGMDANIALFGLAFIMLGIFNLIFFTCYYKNPEKVGAAFLKACAGITIYMLLAETCTHAVPFVRDKLDTADGQFLSAKLIVLGAGALIYAGLTLLAWRKSAKSFLALDL